MRYLLVLLAFLSTPPALCDNALSVYRVDLATDLAVSGAALAGMIVPYAFASSIVKPRCPCLITEINGLDRGGANNHSDTAMTISDAVVALAVVGPIAANAFAVGTGDVFWEDVVVFTEAVLVSGALVSMTKVIAQRPLPRTYQGDPSLVPNAGGYRSFYSGHTTTAATALSAAAVTLSLRYDQNVWPWLVVGGVTATVSALRVLGGAHFISDTLVGAAAGVTVGVLVPLLHRRKNSTSAFRILPERGGASVRWSLRF